MQPISETIQLAVSQAACLDAVRSGLDGKTRIAVETKQDLKTVAVALEGLNRARLVRQVDRFRWRPTKRGRSCTVRAVPDPKRRLGGKAFGKLVPGSTAERLLDALDRPMRGKDLTGLLGVSPQRVHQIVVRLLAQDRVRIGDQAHVLHIVARSDDSSVLLTRDEARVLSALPDDATTVATGLGAVIHIPVARVQDVLHRLCELGLVQNAGTRRDKALYRLSSAGREHFQRGIRARRAKPALLVVRSDRVRDVLSNLSDRGQARIKDLRDALGIAHPSMNALMQYLKRKRLVTKVDEKLSAPYELTDEGREALAEMMRPAA